MLWYRIHVSPELSTKIIQAQHQNLGSHLAYAKWNNHELLHQNQQCYNKGSLKAAFGLSPTV